MRETELLLDAAQSLGAFQPTYPEMRDLFAELLSPEIILERNGQTPEIPCFLSKSEATETDLSLSLSLSLFEHGHLDRASERALQQPAYAETPSL